MLKYEAYRTDVPRPSKSIYNLRILEGGVIHEITNRTVDSLYLLLGDREEVEDIIGSWLARAQKKFPVRLYADVVMSNHFHFLISATNQHIISNFMQYFQGHVAASLNRFRGRHGAFWSGRYTSVPILDEETLLDRFCYINLNPVAAGLCLKPEDSPVVCSARELLTGERKVYSYKTYDKELKRWVNRKAGIKRHVLPFLRNKNVKERQAFIRKALSEHRSNTPRKRPRKPVRSWRLRPQTKRKTRVQRPLCYASCAKRIKQYAFKVIEITKTYAKAAAHYAAGRLEDAHFPDWTFVPSRVPMEMVCGKNCA